MGRPETAMEIIEGDLKIQSDFGRNIRLAAVVAAMVVVDII